MAVSEEARKRKIERNSIFNKKNYTALTYRYRNELEIRERILNLGHKSVNDFITQAVLDKLEREENDGGRQYE